MRARRIFLFEVKINSSDCPDYNEGDKIWTAIETSSKHNAIKLFDRYYGSEYPSFHVEEIYKCDEGLFSPQIRSLDIESRWRMIFYKCAFAACRDHTGFSELTKYLLKELYERCERQINLSWFKVFGNDKLKLTSKPGPREASIFYTLFRKNSKTLYP